MKRIVIVFLTVLLLIVVPLSITAHSGNTDSRGGHYDHSDGTYHYHHGYSEHRHYDIDGDGKRDCPYEMPNPGAMIEIKNYSFHIFVMFLLGATLIVLVAGFVYFIVMNSIKKTKDSWFPMLFSICPLTLGLFALNEAYYIVDWLIVIAQILAYLLMIPASFLMLFLIQFVLDYDSKKPKNNSAPIRPTSRRIKELECSSCGYIGTDFYKCPRCGCTVKKTYYVSEKKGNKH